MSSDRPDAGPTVTIALAAHGGRPVLDGVLDQRLHSSSARRAARALSSSLTSAPLAEPRPLDLEVGPHELQLVVQDRPLALGSAQRVAEDIGKLLDRPVRDVGSRWISPAIEFSALKRKCGLICARSALSSERLACRERSRAGAALLLLAAPAGGGCRAPTRRRRRATRAARRPR